MTVEFDVEGARRAGYSDSDIANHLGKIRQFNVKGARESGVADDEIVYYLTTGKQYDRTVGEGISGGIANIGRGVVGGVATAAGGAVAAGQLLSPTTISLESSALVRGEPSPVVGPTFRAVEGAPRAASEAMFGDPNYLTYESVNSLPKAQRPFAVAGEVIGGSVPFAALPIGLARAGVTITSENMFGRIFGGILDSARKSPKTFAAVEASSIAGGAQGAALAEAIAPSNTFYRIGGEIVGSVLNPMALAIKPVKMGASGVKRLVESLSPDGRMRAAGDYIHAVVAQFGEDPIALVQALRAADEMGITLPSGVKTGSPSLLALESSLSKHSSPLDLRIQERINSSLVSLRRAAETLELRGNPEDLKLAATLRQRHISQLIDGKMSAAEQSVAEARARITSSLPSERMAISQEAHGIMNAALRDARKMETELWEAVPRDINVEPSGFLSAVTKVKGELLPGEALQGVPKKLLEMIEGSTPVTSGNLIRIRSRLLTLAREASAQNRFGDARHLGILADGALDDLSRITGHEATIARSFSTELNDRFTRTFTGNALGTTATGAERIPPELMLERAFGSGGAAAEVRFKALREAASFAETGGANFLQPIVNAQENMVRAAALASRDPVTGAINPQRLSKFITDNEPALSRFPELRKTLSDAVAAEQEFKNTEQLIGRFTRRVAQVDSFARLIDFENPAMAVASVLNGKNPVADFTSMARFAAKSGPGAVGGLRAATMDHAMNVATGKDGAVSFRLLGKELFDSKSQHPSLIEMMVSNKIIAPEQIEALKKIVKKGVEIETRQGSRARIGEEIGGPSGLEDMIVRIAGAKMATVGAAATGRAESLIAAAAGSRFLRNLFQQVPITRTRDLLYEAVENPELMARLLEKGHQPKDVAAGLAGGVSDILKEAKFRRMHSVLWQAALVPNRESSSTEAP